MDRKHQMLALAGILDDAECGRLKEAKRALKTMIEDLGLEEEGSNNAGGWQKGATAHERQY